MIVLRCAVLCICCVATCGRYRCSAFEWHSACLHAVVCTRADAGLNFLHFIFISVLFAENKIKMLHTNVPCVCLCSSLAAGLVVLRKVRVSRANTNFFFIKILSTFLGLVIFYYCSHGLSLARARFETICERLRYMFQIHNEQKNVK